MLLGDYRIRFVYECADGFMNFTFLFGEPIGHATARFIAWMDEEGFATETLRNEDWVRYAAKMMGGETTVEAHEEVLAAIERFTRTKTKAEILEAAFERNLLIVPLNDCGDLVASEHLAEREFWVPIKHPGMDREILHPGAFARMSATPPPGTMPSSTAARVACSASSTRAFFSFISVSVAAPTFTTATPPTSFARRS